MAKKKELTWGDRIRESAKTTVARNLPIPYFVVDEIYSRVTGNPSDSNRALYAGVNPLDDQPDMSLRGVGLAISQWSGFLTKWLRRDFDNLDYDIGEDDPIGVRVAQAAWAKYNRLPYDETLIKDNGDGTFSIPKEITSKIRTDKEDIEKAYNTNKENLKRIEDEYSKLIHTATENNDLARAQQLREEKKKDRRIWLYNAALTMDEENLKGVDGLLSNKRGVFNMFNTKDRNLHKSLDTDLNVLNNFTIYKDDNGKYRYKDVYDFSPLDILLNGDVFKIEGDINEAPSSSSLSSFGEAFSQAKRRGDKTFTWNGKIFNTEEKRHGGALFEETGDIWTTGLDVVRTFGDGGLVERQDHVYERLTEDYNMPPLQAVAIIANLTAESGLDPLAEGDSGQSVGIQQWKGERRKKLEAAARKNGDFLPSLDDQIDFLMSEYKGGGFQFRDQGRNLYVDGKVNNSIFDYYQYSKGEFDNADNLWDATIAWNQGVGRPNKKFAANEKRFKIAQEIADRHGVEYNETSRYDVMGPLSVPPESIYKEKDEASAVQVQGSGPDIEEREKEFMSHVEELLSLSERKSGNVNIYINDSADVSKSLEADDLETRRRIAEDEQREKERRLIEAVLPGIQLNIRTI